MTGEGRQALVVRGITWSFLYQVIQAGLQFAAMLLLVRIIPAEEYGRVATALGLFNLLNSFNCAWFMAQALQLPDDAEPDWSLHWSAGWYIQAALSLLVHLAAGLCWLLPDYRPAAPLLHLGALGLLVDPASRLSLTMLQRAMDFRRLRIIQGLGTLISIGVTVACGLAGWGAYAIVLGSIFTTVPFAVDLLAVQRWRPRAGWWRMPRWKSYTPALQFGWQQVGAGLLHYARGAVEAAVLPAACGYTAIGWWSRAQALYGSTLGRVESVFVETVYPLLPRYAADPERYPRQATLFAQVILLLILPCGLFLGLLGPEVSRLVYGTKWIAADPLLWPGVLLGLGAGLFLVGWHVLLAVNRLRACFALSVAASGLCVPTVLVAWTGGGLTAYAWTVALAQVCAGGLALFAAAPLMGRGWVRVALGPPLVCSLLAASVVWALGRWTAAWPLAAGLAFHGLVYAGVLLLGLRALFPTALAALLSRLPGSLRLQGWLGLLPSSGTVS